MNEDEQRDSGIDAGGEGPQPDRPPHPLDAAQAIREGDAERSSPLPEGAPRVFHRRRRSFDLDGPPKVIVAGGLDEGRAYVPPTAVRTCGVPREEDQDTPRVLIHEPAPISTSKVREVTWISVLGTREDGRDNLASSGVPGGEGAAGFAGPPGGVGGTPRDARTLVRRRSFDSPGFGAERPTLFASDARPPDGRWIGVIAGVAATVMISTWLLCTSLVRPEELPPPMAAKGLDAALRAAPSALEVANNLDDIPPTAPKPEPEALLDDPAPPSGVARLSQASGVTTRRAPSRAARPRRIADAPVPKPIEEPEYE
jgi:hypothetical protein